MSKKSKKKAVSQAELRQLMKEMKKKRGNDVANKPKEKAPISDKEIKALQEKRLKLLNEPKKKSVSFSVKVTTTDKPIPKNNAKQSKKDIKAPKKSSLKHKNTDDNFSKPSKKTKFEEPEINNPSLPADFFDNSVNGNKNIPVEAAPKEEDMEEKMETETKPTEPESAIPKGFFDDPTKDSKVRGVETPEAIMDREWESFKKEIQKEETQSEQIVDEYQETSHAEREIDEIDEQLRFLSRVEKLNDKRDEIKRAVPNIKKNDMSMDSDQSDEDFEIDTLDWREKYAFID